MSQLKIVSVIIPHMAKFQSVYYGVGGRGDKYTNPSLILKPDGYI